MQKTLPTVFEGGEVERVALLSECTVVIVVVRHL